MGDPFVNVRGQHADQSGPPVVALVASCDLAAPPTSQALHCAISEFAVLRGGDVVLLRSGLGWSASVPPGGDGDPWRRLGAAGLTRQVLTAVLPDGEDEGDHPWQQFGEALARAGHPVEPQTLRSVPYLVVPSPRLHAVVGGEAVAGGAVIEGDDG